MDEVDVDNAEDLNELEERLYAQIHHEAIDVHSCDEIASVPTVREIEQSLHADGSRKATRSRYWTNGSTQTNAIKTTTQTQVGFNSVNAGKSNDTNGVHNAPTTIPTTIAANASVNTATVDKDKNNKTNCRNTTPCAKKPNEQVNPKNTKTEFRINPAATCFGTKSNKAQRNAERQQRSLLHPRSEFFAVPPTGQQGPFTKQMQKLTKAQRIDAKRQKSKQARAKKKQQQQQQPIETIVLQSSDETTCDDDDVIVVPVPPPPIISVDDSDVEDEEKTFVLIEEDAQHAADVQLQHSSFVMPTPAAATLEKRNENTSRCNSPSSVQSSDDFIEHNDRCRLQESGMADDEDLLLLTADVDSLMETPAFKDVSIINKRDNTHAHEESSNEVECTNFVPPAKAAANKQNYRVEQTQFSRALDVYESESDITDNVYSKGAAKPTVIRAISNSSDDVTRDIDLGQKTKRLRKRRASGSNKESETQLETDDDDDDNDGVEQTSVPFISRGPAVERCKSKTRKDSFSMSSRRASAGGASVGQMSDHEFITTLNNLAQGGNETDDENEDSDEDEDAAPTARDIAERVLERTRKTQTSAGVVAERNISESNAAEDGVSVTSAPVIVPTKAGTAAVPVEAVAALESVFKTIDQMDKPKSESVTPCDVVDVSDNSDCAALTTPVAAVVQVKQNKTSGSARKRNSKREQETIEIDEGPKYHVVYSRGGCQAGGIGWNDEMRRFYNDSWKGENFTLRDVWQTLDPRKELWKVYTDDRFPTRRIYSNRKCFNCCEFGHTRAKCKRPKKPLVCYMCGESGHHEPRCPNTICLRCGNKTHVFTKSCNACTFQNRLICPVCKVRGHTINFCPDKWRRYHSTTESNAYPSNRVEYVKKKFCCVCGGRGHLSESCKSAVRFMEYPIIVSDVRSHQKSYDDLSGKTTGTSIAMNLLYKPCEHISFELAEHAKASNYYGRFLKAVGMEHMLKRKRKLSTMATAEKKNRKLSRTYVTNPYSKAGEAERSNVDQQPEQVQEVSGSVDANADAEVATIISSDDNLEQENVADDVDEGAEETEIIDEVGDITPEIAEQLSIENFASFKSPTTKLSPTTAQTQNEMPLHLDSDSNYSFSEHFEMPNATIESVENSTAPATKSTVERRQSRHMEALPDFIPLHDSAATNDNERDDDDEVNFDVGISRRFISADDDNDATNSSPLPDLPCEAKIYLTHFHSKYLLSPEGHAFLVEKSKACDVKARLDWTSVGHVLIIFGLQSNQDGFHRELLMKYRELMDRMQQKRGETTQKVPRRADVLIRFLRENINQLLMNLGNVNELFRRLKYLEKQHSKTGLKSAEKTRRSLNMILLGQAGLLDGNRHLDKLLRNLKTLLNDYKPEDLATHELRHEIDEHWKVIFTAYRHDNYTELVQDYNKLIMKNRIPKLNIDPILLGQKLLDTNLTNEQKERLERTHNKQAHHANIVPNPFNPKNSKLLGKATSVLPAVEMAIPAAPSMKVTAGSNMCSPNKAPPPPSMKINAATTPDRAPPAPTMKTKTNTTTPTTPAATKNKAATTPTQGKKPNTNMPAPPCANPAQKSNAVTQIKNVTQQWEHTCNNLLTEINNDSAGGPQKKGLVNDCRAPSMFWSRESFKYLDKCIKLAATNSELLEKLQRVHMKSQNGALSYNDYRAVIKLHSTMSGK